MNNILGKNSCPNANIDSDINSIITTIVDDNNEESRVGSNYKLESKPTPLLTHSKSQNDLQFECLQSQNPIEEDKKFKIDYNEQNSAFNNTVSKSNYLDQISCITVKYKLLL